MVYFMVYVVPAYFFVCGDKKTRQGIRHRDFETFLCFWQYKSFDLFVGIQVPIVRTLQVLSLPAQDGDEDKE